MTMTTKLMTAQREVERLRMQAAAATDVDVAIWEAENRVADIEQAQSSRTVRTARQAARLMDVVLFTVAALTMAFSMGNIHDFASAQGVPDPIAWFLAPAVDLALVAALVGDAVLSRWQLDAGEWAVRLRWFAGGATLTLNVWQSVARLDAAAIVIHVVPPTLLFVLAEAAIPYRHQFARTVELAAAKVDSAPVDTATETTPEAPETVPDTVPEVWPEPAVSTQTSQGMTPAPLYSVRDTTEADSVPERLDTQAAREAIEAAWESGLTVREAAAKATRAPSYVGTVYAQLTKVRGPQPMRGQTAISAA
jgi:hypothetical protein